MTVIELDPSAPWTPPVPSPVGRRFGPALLVLLVTAALLNGPCLRGGAALALAWRAEVVGGFFWLSETSAYTVDWAGTATDPRLAFTARDPADGTPRWTVELTGPLATSYLRGSETMVSRFPPTLDQGTNTSVIDTRTGAVVRAYPAAAMPLVYLAADVAITIDRDPAAGSEPPLPALSLNADGSDRPHLMVARDLGTGAVRWTRQLPPGTSWSVPGVHPATEGIVALPPGQDWMVTSDRAGLVRTWDLRAGTPIAARAVGAVRSESYVTALESTVVSRATGGGRVSIAAYDPRTLEEVWRGNPPPIYASPFQCGELLCLQTDRAVWAVDRTGALSWRVDVPRLRPATWPARMLVTSFGEQLALFDPATGAPLPADSRWLVVDMAPSGSRVVLARPDAGGAAGDAGARLALLDAAAGTITPVGDIGVFSLATQCLASAGRIACEDAGVARVWRR